MKKIKKVLSIIIVFAIILTLTYMGYMKIKKEKDYVIEDKKITLRVLTNRTDLVDSSLKDLAREYESMNPNVQVEFEGIKQRNDLLKIKAASRESLDITIVPTNVTKKALVGFYEDIDDLGFNENNTSGYYDGIGSDNKLHAVNAGVGYSGIIYNKVSFNKAGIDKIPETIEEFYEVCDKLKQVGIIPFAINAADKWPLTIYSEDFILPMEFTGDNDYVNSLNNKDLFCNDNGLYKSLSFLESMMERGYLEKDITGSNWSVFKVKHADAQVAMTFLGSWYPEQLIELGAKEDKIGMFPFPDTKVIVENKDWLFAISNDCKNIMEAKKLFKWLFYDGNYARACNLLPTIKSETKKYDFLNELLSYNKPIIMENAKNEETIEKFNEFKYSLPDIFYEYLTSDDKDAVIKKYNDLWKESSNT